MKTKFRTFIAISALGFIGFTNINATVDNKKVIGNDIVIEEESDEALTIESWMTDESNFNSIEVLTAIDADVNIKKYATRQNQQQENVTSKSDLIKSTDTVTTSGADKKQVSLEQKK